MDCKLDLTLHGTSLNIVRQSKSDLKKILRSKFGCDATIAGIEFEGDAGVAQPNWSGVVSEKRFEITLDSGILVSVWKANLTDFPADAVVNAANENLRHIGGLALALSKAGGPSIQKDSDDYIRRYDTLKPGNATIMDAGSLPCKKIIHAVGPRLSRYVSKSDISRAELLLSQVICKILDIAEENHLQTVAIPAISSGLFNYPLPECADTIVKTVKEYRGSPGHYLKEIQLVNNDEPTVREMERACRQILTTYQRPTRVANSGANQGRKLKANTKTPTSIVQFGNVSVTIKKGCIENERTDVIVNTASKGFWKSGEVSKAILRKAGRGMEKELEKASAHDTVIVTKAYNLSCKEVYHTVCPDSWDDNAAEILTGAVFQCLQWASKSHSSISFPAIGTGRQGFKKSDVAKMMSRALALFAEQCPKKMDVYFVIHPSDSEIFKAFEEVMSQGHQKESPHSLTHVQEQRDEYRSSTPPSPQISLTGPSDEATHEAEKWLSHLLFQSSSQVLISNNFILYFGQQEQWQLRQMARDGIDIEESFDNGRVSIMVKGNSTADVVVAALQVEAMLCNVLREFIREEERLFLKSAEEITYERTAVGHFDPEYLHAKAMLQHLGLHIVKVERVKNDILKQSFELRKAELGFITTRNMFQCIPAHFCDIVCRIGFNGECAPPDDPAYGEGIYFASTVEKALEVWKLPKQEYLYFVEAEVLTGNSTRGHRGLIVPPVPETGPAQRFDSVSGGPDVSVVFSGCQALPTKIIICRISAV